MSIWLMRDAKGLDITHRAGYLDVQGMRTTINVDDPILQELRKVAEEKGLSLGRVVSDLLADALHGHGRTKQGPADAKPFRFVTKPMRALVDIDDMAAVLDAADAADARMQRRSAKAKKKRG